MSTTALKERAWRLGEGVHTWLTDSSGLLQAAVAQTVENKLFLSDDVHFALQDIQRTVTPGVLLDWAEAAKCEGGASAVNKRVLCLHAGNLPLVGFQDVVACLMSGATYAGKISRKDPWLLPSLLQQLKQDKGFDDITYSSSLSSLKGLQANMVLFSGSERSIPEIRKILEQKQILAHGARELIRTAHSSLAWIPELAPEQLSQTAADMAKATFRYEGKGCRTLTTAFTGHDTRELLQAVASAAGTSPYIQQNLLGRSLPPLLKYKAAFCEAIGREHVVIGDRLIQVSEPEVHTEGLITLTGGTLEDCRAYLDKQGGRIQSLYIPGGKGPQPEGVECEPLEQAQTPPLSWKPDGTDPLKWICSGGTI